MYVSIYVFILLSITFMNQNNYKCMDNYEVENTNILQNALYSLVVEEELSKYIGSLMWDNISTQILHEV